MRTTNKRFILVGYTLALCCQVAGAAGCTSPGDAQPPARNSAPARDLGSWTGSGSRTLGFVSESGSFRIMWKAQNEDPKHPGTFQLTLRSGISGRPMKVVADHRGDGSGSEEFGDDPRIYEFLVDASGVEWRISVVETFAPPRPGTAR